MAGSSKTVSVKFKKFGDLNTALGKIAAKLGNRPTVVRVGFLEGRTYPVTKTNRKPLPVARVAFWNEFGTKRTKARPFFRNTIRDLAPTLGKRVAAVGKSVGWDAKKTLELVGIGIKDKLVKAIAGWPADNAPSTVKRKGFNHGLIDKGIMQRSVDLEVNQ